MCMTLGSRWRVMMRQCDTPKARAACTYSSSRSLRVSARSSRHRPAQPVRPRIMHSRNSRRSARAAEVSNSSAWLSM
ncbi:Uncharacterised protein [Bordetella pertussis]|nr:Uncharacterised protein [Bordetella pertussis]CFW10787.1 Uncharacterised protein [Bordetella pertussis]